MEARAATGKLRGRGRKIFAQAEAPLDTASEAPAGADIRASRTIRMLGEEYLADSIQPGKQPRTMEGRESRLNAHILLTIGDVPAAATLSVGDFRPRS